MEKIGSVRKEAITNYEVLQCLRQYSKHRQEDSQQTELEQQVKEYLNSTPVQKLTREQIENQVTNLAGLALSKAEKLQLLNLQPTTVVELYLVMSNLEERFSEEEIQTILKSFNTE